MLHGMTLSYTRICHYSLYDKHVSNSALKALRRHLWYLTEEMVPLALFSDVTPAEEKRTIAKGLLEKFGTHSGGTDAPTKHYGSGFGKPKFPEHLEPTSRLYDFAGEDSWYFFKLLDLDPGFLQKPVENWHESDAFIKNLTKIQGNNVINNGAERYIKLSLDFIGSAQNEEVYQDILQVMEQQRKEQHLLQK